MDDFTTIIPISRICFDKLMDIFLRSADINQRISWLIMAFSKPIGTISRVLFAFYGPTLDSLSTFLFIIQTVSLAIFGFFRLAKFC